MRPEEELRDEESMRNAIKDSQGKMLLFGVWLSIGIIATVHYFAEWDSTTWFWIFFFYTLLGAGGFAWYFWKWWILDSVLKGVRARKAMAPSIPSVVRASPEVKIEWEEKPKKLRRRK